MARGVARSTNGITPVFRKGVKKKALEQGGRGRSDMVFIRTGDSALVQFLQSPEEWFEFSEHQWQEDGRWHFIPCLGKDNDCPLCEDESDDRSRVRYQWVANVFNIKDKKVQVMKGGKDLGTRLFGRYENKPNMFTKRVIQVTKYATNPISFEAIPENDVKPVRTENLKLIDLEDWLTKEATEFYGDLTTGPSSLDDPEPGDECPECGTELDEDGECPNPDCEYDPAQQAEAVDECPECGELLNEDGECENPECDAYEEPEPKPKPKPGRKAAARGRRPARR